MKLISKIFLSLTVLYASMIFYLSSIPYLKMPRVGATLFNRFIHFMQHSDYSMLFIPFYPFIRQQDKVAHILLYFGFGILLFLTLKSTYKSFSKSMAFSFFLGLFYGMSDEFHQRFVPGRSADVMDLAADATGLLLAGVIVLMIYTAIAVFSYLSARKREIRD